MCLRDQVEFYSGRGWAHRSLLCLCRPPCCPGTFALAVLTDWHAPRPYNHDVYALVSPPLVSVEGHCRDLPVCRGSTLPHSAALLVPCPTGGLKHLAPWYATPVHAPSVCVVYSRCSGNTDGVDVCFPDLHGFGLAGNYHGSREPARKHRAGARQAVCSHPASSSALMGCHREGRSRPLTQSWGEVGTSWMKGGVSKFHTHPA